MRPASFTARTGRAETGGGQNGARLFLSRQQYNGEAPPPTRPGARRHCTAGEIAAELGYSISYILAVKKAMYPILTTRPRRLDPAEVSQWIFEHPSFRMRDMYEHHPTEAAQGQALMEF